MPLKHLEQEAMIGAIGTRMHEYRALGSKPLLKVNKRLERCLGRRIASI